MVIHSVCQGVFYLFLEYFGGFSAENNTQKCFVLRSVSKRESGIQFTPGMFVSLAEVRIAPYGKGMPPRFFSSLPASYFFTIVRRIMVWRLPPGGGKTGLAFALGVKAEKAGRRVLFFSAEKLVRRSWLNCPLSPKYPINSLRRLIC